MKIISRHNLLRLSLPLLIVGFVGTALLEPLQVAALSGNDFHAGHIIDDTIFTNSNAMSVQDIQNFLNAKVPNCDSWGTQPYGNTTRAAFSRANGHPLPLVCLKGYYENPTTHANNLTVTDGQPVAPPAGSVSAAQIIYDAAHTYNINPQVLLVTLQKEQGLVTDDWPWTTQFTKAMGYACPDTAACNTTYYGFYNQVTSAAWQFRHYLDFPNNYNYVVGNDYILYSPASGCGGSNVSIQNQATAALYDYTPYQPIAGALAGVSDTSPGTTVSCGSYGNRNFWWYFNTWFGSSLTSGYAWQPTQQSAYTDSSMTTPIDTANLLPGQRIYVVIKAENIGSVTWQKGVGGRQVNVGTNNPRDRHSIVCDSTWLGSDCNRPATTTEATVAPGQTGTFGFWIKAPGNAGTYNEYFNLVMDGTSWMNNDPGLYWTFKVSPPSWQPTQQSAYTDSSMTTPVNTMNLGSGQRYYMLIKAKNTGSTTWQKGDNTQQVNLGTSNSRDRHSGFCDSTWLNTTDCNRIVTTSESTVAPGQIGTFGFWITTPAGTGTFNEYFNLVMDGTSWLNDPGLYWTYHVSTSPAWQPTQQSAYTDSTMTTPVNTLSLSKGQRYYLVIKAQNTGNTVWQKGVYGRQVNVGTSNPRDRHSGFCDSTWLNPTDCNRLATSSESTIGPGQTGTFGFWITAPSTVGTYNEYYSLVMDGITWMNDPGLYWTLAVH